MEAFPKMDSIYSQMENIVPKKYISTSSFERIKSAQDPFPYEVTMEQVPHVVVMPGTKEEIVEILLSGETDNVRPAQVDDSRREIDQLVLAVEA